MEEIHSKHNIVLDSITQDEDDGALTQGTAASRMSLSTIITSGTNASYKLTEQDVNAFQQAVDSKNDELTGAFNAAKRQHREEEDAMQKQILELQAKKSALDLGESPMSLNLALTKLISCLTHVRTIGWVHQIASASSRRKIRR